MIPALFLAVPREVLLLGLARVGIRSARSFSSSASSIRVVYPDREITHWARFISSAFSSVETYETQIQFPRRVAAFGLCGLPSNTTPEPSRSPIFDKITFSRKLRCGSGPEMTIR